MSRNQSPNSRAPRPVHPFVHGAGWRITHSSNLEAYAPGHVVRIEPDAGQDGRFSLVWTDPAGRVHRLCGLTLAGRDRLQGIDGTGAYRVLVEQPVGAGRIFVKVSCSLGGSSSLPLAGIWGAEAVGPEEPWPASLELRTLLDRRGGILGPHP